MAPKSEFGENLFRLFGMHGLTATAVAEILGVQKAGISHWRSGRREPSLGSMLRLADFFEVNAGDLMHSTFKELLPALADQERFTRVEKKIRARKTKLKAVS